MLLYKRYIVFILFFVYNIFVGHSQSLSGISPQSDAYIYQPSVTFQWNSMPSALDYTIMLSQNPYFTTNVIQSPSISVTNWSTTILNYGIWYWKVIGNDGSLLTSSNVKKFTYFVPSQSNNLCLWLKADAGLTTDINGKVQTWTDLSPSAYQFTQSNAIKRPSVSANSLNNLPSLAFSGTQFLNGGDILDLESSNRSMFVIGKMAASNQTLFAKSLAANSSNRYSLVKDGSSIVFGYHELSSSHIISSFNNTSFALYNLIVNRSAINKKLIVNNSILGSSPISLTYNMNSTYRFLIGATNDATDFGEIYYLNGNISEIVFINSTDNLEISQIQNYLHYKYAPPINLGADYTPNNFCPITLTAPTGYTNLLWSTGATSSSVTLNQSGTYWVQGTDLFGYVSRDTVMVNYPVINPPLNTNICLNSSVQWNADMGAGYTYLWNNGATTPILNISSPGTYSVQVTDALGCIKNSNPATFTVDTYAQNVSLGADTSLCSDNLINLQTGAQETAGYFWNGILTTAQPPFWAVDTTGTYFVETVNVNGCFAQDTLHVTVTGQAPLANFSFQNQCFGLPNQFNDASVGLPNDPVSTWQWDFGNGASANTQNPNYTYTTPGVYSVQLYAESAGGCGAYHTELLQVHALPTAAFTEIGHCAEELFEFTNTSTAGGAPLSNYSWNFGQAAIGSANTSTLPNPSCAFMNAGIYQVALEVGDTNGCIHAITLPLNVQEIPVASFLVNNACEGDNVVIQNNSTIGDTFSLVTHYWAYGDGTVAVNPSIAKHYDNYGDYTILLVETASNGCVDSMQQNITIHPNPELAWEIGPACQFTYTEFTNNSTVPVGSISSTDWLVNLQYPYSSSSATYPFLTTGIQYLNLSTTSDQGCISDTLILVNVSGPLQANFTVVPSDLVAGISSVFSSSSIGATNYSWDFGDGNIASGAQATHSYAGSQIGNTLTVSLQVSNDLGCLDTLDQSYTIGAPHFDLALSNLFCQDIASYWTIGCELKNQGSIAITQANLVASLLNGLPIMETWQGALAPDESTIYVFQSHPAAYIGTQDDEISYLCIDGEGFNVLNMEDEQLSNNTICKNLETDGVVLLPIFPNPGNSFLDIQLFAPSAQNISLNLYDMQGRMIYTYSENELLSAGVHSINIPTQQLSSGSYLLRLSDAIGSQIRKWVKE
jgi:PKD repeat protein